METQVWESQNKSYFTLYTSRQWSLWVQKIGVYGEWVVRAHRSEHYILFINREWGHYREISDNIKAKVWDFLVMTKQMRLISIVAFSLWTWPCNQLKPTTGQKKKQWVVPLRLQYNQVTLVHGCPFWQLSVDHNMDVHKDVHYQVKHRLYTPWTPTL